MYFRLLYFTFCGPSSSVGIATMGWTVRGSNPGGARYSAPVQTGPGAHPASYTMGTVSFPGVKYGRGVLLTTQPLPVPWSWKRKAKPLPTLWATTGPVTGTLYLYYVHSVLLFNEITRDEIIQSEESNLDSDNNKTAAVHDSTHSRAVYSTCSFSHTVKLLQQLYDLLSFVFKQAIKLNCL